MIKVLMERGLPANFDLTDDAQAAAHAAAALRAHRALEGRMHWLSTYGTDTGKLFGLVAVEDDKALADYLELIGAAGPVTFHKVLRVLDPATAR